MLGWLVRRGMASLPSGLKYEMFYQSARALGVTAYQANGDAGPIFGPLYDQTVTKTYLRDRTWSPGITGLFLDFFSGGKGTFYDIGANVGLITIPVSATGVRCVAFEPEPLNFSLLRANVNGRPNVELRNVAVADRAGEMRFARDPYNSGDHRLASDGAISVQTICLDDEPAPEGPFAVKIDTQGAEPAIFTGGQGTLARADLIVCEFWPWGMKRMGLSPEPVLGFVRQHFALPDRELTMLDGLVASCGPHDFTDIVLSRKPLAG